MFLIGSIFALCRPAGLDHRNSSSHNDHMDETEETRQDSQVGSRELKTRLGKYLRLVREGRTLIVTARGEPIAELRPLQRAGESKLQSRFRRLVAEGKMTLGRLEGLQHREPVTVLGDSQRLSQAVAEDRARRF